MKPPIKILKCPCCGNDDLYCGPMSATSMGVECWLKGGGCRLSIEVSYPWNDDNAGRRTLEQLEHELLIKAIESWNKRI